MNRNLFHQNPDVPIDERITYIELVDILRKNDPQEGFILDDELREGSEFIIKGRYKITVEGGEKLPLSWNFQLTLSPRQYEDVKRLIASTQEGRTQ